MLSGNFFLGAAFGGLASVQLAAGIPTTSPSCKGTVATFDDIKVEDPTGPTTAVGDSKGLRFQAINVDSVSRSAASGVLPQSGTQLGAFGLTSQLSQGDSDLCRSPATQEFLVALPAACEINLTAFDTNNQQVASQALTFQPKALLSQMNFVQFDSKKFSNLGRIVFTFKSLVDKATVAGLLDDLSFTACPK
ncbi:MAG: hypothetical protein L6R40_006173 [Gallowayella cf. fulva]|nr:MAG: hypothetical protein L6R40_006173 [Xanthomendoza cf. fulva]